MKKIKYTKFKLGDYVIYENKIYNIEKEYGNMVIMCILQEIRQNFVIQFQQNF